MKNKLKDTLDLYEPSPDPLTFSIQDLLDMGAVVEISFHDQGEEVAAALGKLEPFSAISPIKSKMSSEIGTSAPVWFSVETMNLEIRSYFYLGLD